jgi:outer membrane receptor protein involved in Fe transport
MNYIPSGLTETRGRKVKQFFSVRGQKYPYPDYAVNDIWQKEFHEVPYFFSSCDIEEIEIVRSSAALLTGLSGLSGVIKLKTREYDSMETALKMDYGSFETFHGHLSHGGRAGKISYAAGIGYDRTSGPPDMHAAENMINANGRIRWDLLPSLSVSANFFHLHGRQELRKAEPPAAQRFQDLLQTFDKIRTTLANIKTYYRPSNRVSSELQLYYARRKPVFIDEVNEARTEESDFEWGLNFIQSLALSSANTLRLGGLYNHWLAPNGKRFYVGRRCDTETFSLVAVDEHKIGAATIDAGFRWSRTYMNEYGAFNIEGSGGKFRNVYPIVDEWQSPLIQGSIGFTYNMKNQMSVHMNASFGQVKPREGSLDTSLTLPANETRIKLDLGMIKDWKGGGRLVITPFIVKQLNAIEYSGQTHEHPVTGMIMELYENREQDQVGVELETRTPRLLNIFSAFYNITLMNSGIWMDGERIINKEHPALITNGGIYLARSGFDLNIFAKYVSAFENDRFANPPDGSQPLGDFFTMDITGGYTIGAGKSIRIYFNISNLTNNKYSTVVGYPDFGRRIGFGFRIVN